MQIIGPGCCPACEEREQAWTKNNLPEEGTRAAASVKGKDLSS